MDGNPLICVQVPFGHKFQMEAFKSMFDLGLERILKIDVLL
jgi:hypothetical protein